MHEHHHGTGTAYLDDIRSLLDADALERGWTIRPTATWCYLEPPGLSVRSQGWKIHVAATLRSAPDVLRACLPILLGAPTHFKFAIGEEHLRRLLSIRCDRGSGGKFITVYPDDDRRFVELIARLHTATEGMDGPAILSDKPYTAGSLVHYRYGAMSGSHSVLDNDGAYGSMLVAPDGRWEEDSRNAWFSPPAWAPNPLPDPPAPVDETKRGSQSVLLDSRFVVTEAIRHSNRGGVYRATDQQTGAGVIIKQARPWVAGDHDGNDARTFLRNEAAMLDLLATLGIAPAAVSLFEHQEHLFLAEEELTGTPLRGWVRDRLDDSHTRTLDDHAETVADFATQLVDLVEGVHGLGLVFRDLTPGNVMVTDGNRLMIIDPEFMAHTGAPVTRAMTMGYVAPEEMHGPDIHPAPGPVADRYSLGACLLHLCTGLDVPLVGDDMESRSHDQKIVDRLASAGAAHPLVARYAPLVRGLMAREPAARWDLDQTRAFLATVPTVALGAPGGRPLSTDRVAELVADGLRAIAADTSVEHHNLWPPNQFGHRHSDPCSVQGGAAGPVELLRRAVATGSDDLAETFERSAHALLHLVPHERKTLPGLYFGRAGTAWTLFEAGDALHDEPMRDQALALANRLPVAWGNPDITHGVSGAGTALLHLWRRTGDPALRRRVDQCVQSVVDGMETDGDRVMWPVRGDFDSALVGSTHLGFAHGVAGICTFLLDVGREFDRPELVDLAVRGGRFLVREAVAAGAGLRWPTGSEDSTGNRAVCWWCSGSGGIGQFLIRLWSTTRHDEFRSAAHRAALACRAEKWMVPTVHCHGLAGNGELMLDMAAATGDQTYLEWAAEHADVLYQHAFRRSGLLVIPDERGVEVSHSYNLGMAGPLAFLHRMLHGGARFWTVDDVGLTLPAPSAATEFAVTGRELAELAR